MSYNPFTLSGKTILITGATSGIGLSVCETVHRMGGTVIAIGRDFSKLEALDLGSHHQFIKFDLSDLDKIAELILQLPGIDGFVHSAGIVELNPIKFFKPELYESIRKTNLDSFLYIMNGLVKKKKLNASSSIVAISSISGIYGMKGNGLYGMTKAALNLAVKTFANELAGQKIRVNAVAPGMVKTQITLNTIETLGSEQIKADESKYPLGYGAPEDVANPVVFLLSDAAKWITGEILTLDGGRTAVI